MNVEDELRAVVSLLGTVLMRIEQSRMKESWIARHDPGAPEIKAADVMLAVRLAGGKEALGHVHAARQIHPDSALLRELERAFDRHIQDTETTGMAALRALHQTPVEWTAPVIQLFPDKPPRGEPES